MYDDTNFSFPSPLESVQHQFETWREHKKAAREPIPEHLWEAASKLHEEYPISRISKALRVNHADLKNRIYGKSKPRRKNQPSSQFIELKCLSSFSSAECIVEMEDAFGSKMRMHFKGKADLDLLELSKVFWTKGR